MDKVFVIKNQEHVNINSDKKIVIVTCTLDESSILTLSQKYDKVIIVGNVSVKPSNTNNISVLNDGHVVIYNPRLVIYGAKDKTYKNLYMAKYAAENTGFELLIFKME